MNKIKKGFTLVELIVVITILAILGTIAFISLQGYSRDARDSVRISDMKNIEKALELRLLKDGKVIFPDNYVTVTANSKIVGYQGYMGEKASGNLGISKGPKNPLTETFYTYSTNVNRTEYQVVGIIEDNTSSFISQSYANINNLTLLSYGDNVGIVFDLDNNKFIQDDGLDIDIVSSGKNLVVYLDENETITGSGSDFKVLENGGSLAYKLIGYWDFNEGFGTIVKDFSGKGNHGNLIGTTLPTWTGSTNGGALSFSGGFVEIVNIGEEFIDINNDLTINFIVDFKKDLYKSIQKIISITESGGYNIAINHDYESYYDCRVGESIETLCLLIYNGLEYETLPYLISNIEDGILNISYTYEKNTAILYINGKKITEKRLDTNINYHPTTPLCIGSESNTTNCGGQYFIGMIDEVRIYNRSLSENEIAKLYNILK